MLQQQLAHRFARSVEAVHRAPPAEAWYDPVRGQLRADAILDELVREAQCAEPWRLGLVDADLFAPGQRFVLGEATVGGCCAVVGLARLRPDPEREPEPARLFERRVLVEAVHELGHVAGLEHCSEQRCVMYLSTTLADTDRKGPDFCDRCSR